MECLSSKHVTEIVAAFLMEHDGAKVFWDPESQGPLKKDLTQILPPQRKSEVLNMVKLLLASGPRMLQKIIFFSFYRHVLSMATIFYILPRVGREGENRVSTKLIFQLLKWTSGWNKNHLIVGITALFLQCCLAGWFIFQSLGEWHWFQDRAISL